MTNRRRNAGCLARLGRHPRVRLPSPRYRPSAQMHSFGAYTYTGPA